MNKKELSDLLTLDPLDILLVDQDNNQTSIYMNRKQAIGAMTVGNLKLSYNPKLFYKKSEGYLENQLRIHREYHKSVNNYLIGDYKDLNELQNDEKEILDTPKSLMKIVKLSVAFSSWLNFKTLKSESVNTIKSEEVIRDIYAIQKMVLEYGQEFIEEKMSNKDNSSITNDYLNEWNTVQKDLVYLQGRLITNSVKKIEIGQRAHNLLFPKSEF